MYYTSDEWQTDWICTGCKRKENQPYFKPKKGEEKALNCCPDPDYKFQHYTGRVKGVEMCRVFFYFDGHSYAIHQPSHPMDGQKFDLSELDLKPFFLWSDPPPDSAPLGSSND